MIAGRLAAALFCCVVTAIGQSPRDAVKPPTGTAVIFGTVKDANGSPLPRVRVTTGTPFTVGTSPALRTSRTTESDATGRYVIDGLPAGRYLVAAALPGFSPTSFGANALLDTGVYIVLSDGERFDAPLILPRLSAVSGTVVDEFGAPAVAAVSFLVRSASARQGIPFREVMRTESDRRGRYRIEGLPPDRYLVRAVRPGLSDMRRMDPDAIAIAQQAIERPTSLMPDNAPAKERRVTYLPVYYPGVTSSTHATTLLVTPGTQQTGIDLQLQAVVTTTLEGELLDHNGRAAASADTRLLGEDEAQERLGLASANGRFRFGGLPSGRYVVAARLAVNTQQPGDKPLLLWGSRDLFISPDQSIEPVLNLQPGTEISGVVVFDGEDPIPAVSRSMVAQLLAVSGPFAYFPLAVPTITTVDRTDRRTPAARITFDGVPPGRYLITPFVLPTSASGVTSTSDQWSLRSAMFGGVDVSAIPFDVTWRQPVTDLVLTFTRGSTVLSGVITNGAGAPVFAHTLVVFPVDRRMRVVIPGNRVRAVRPDTRGGYVIRGLLPGEYFVALAADFNPADIGPDALDAMESGAVRVRLTEGTPTVQDLQIKAPRP